MPHCVSAYISLGSNQGDGPENLAEAGRLLARFPACRLVARSRVYRTEPQDDKAQPWFHNQAMRLDLGPVWTPESMLQALLSLEKRMGRVRNAECRFGPRIIDLDLLLFGQEVRLGADPAALSLPHPRLEKRAFVLLPLQEISPGLIIPSCRPEKNARTVEALLADLPYRLEGDAIYQ